MSIVVRPSPAAGALARRVAAQHAGEAISFVIDQGCCAGGGLQLQSLPWLDPAWREVGRIGGIPVHCPASLASSIDGSELRVGIVSAEDASDSFSLETALGHRFSSRIVPAGAPA